MGSVAKTITRGAMLPVSALTFGKVSHKTFDDVFDPKMPAVPEPPPPVEDIDAESMKQYTAALAKRRKGRESTILTGIGSSNQGKKTVLG